MNQEEIAEKWNKVDHSVDSMLRLLFVLGVKIDTDDWFIRMWEYRVTELTVNRWRFGDTEMEEYGSK